MVQLVKNPLPDRGESRVRVGSSRQATLARSAAVERAAVPRRQPSALRLMWMFALGGSRWTDLGTTRHQCRSCVRAERLALVA